MKKLLAILMLISCPAFAQESLFTWHTNELNQIVLDAFSDTGEPPLTGIFIPNTIEGLPVVEIGAYCFSGAAFTDVIIGTNVDVIGERAFEGCPVVTVNGLQYPTYIGQYAFIGSAISGDLSFNPQLYALEEAAFQSTLISSAVIPGTVSFIGGGSFAGCHNLINIQFSEGNSILGQFILGEVPLLESVEIPSTISEIQASGFLYCPVLTSVVFVGDAPVFRLYYLDDLEQENLIGIFAEVADPLVFPAGFGFIIKPTANGFINTMTECAYPIKNWFWIPDTLIKGE